MQRFTLFALLLSSVSWAGTWSSGGSGDQVRFYFTEGQLLAQSILENLIPASFDDIESDPQLPELKQWLLHHQKAMAQEVMKVSLVWSEKVQPACAFTFFQPGSDISLSFEKCRFTYSSVDAARLLIHEVSHHFSLSNSPSHELFADRIAILALQGWQSMKLKTIPLCPKGPTDAESLVAKNIFGDWIIDPILTEKLTGKKPDDKFTQFNFEKDIDVLKILPPSGRCAYTAGYFTYDNRGKKIRDPFYIGIFNGQSTLIYFRTVYNQPGQPELNNELLFISLAKARENKNDVLMMGGDHISEPFSVFFRK